MPTEPTDQTEPRDATDAVRRGLAEALKTPGKRTPWGVVPPVRDGDSDLRRGLIAALTPTTTDEENQ